MGLTFNPNIANAPKYVAGMSTAELRQKYAVDDIIKIGSNESPLGPSPRAIEAMQRAAASLNRYPPMGDETLRAVLAETIGQGMTPDNFFTGNGGCDILSMIAVGFLDPTAECIICRPTFPIYESTARKTGAKMIYADLDPDHFTYDVEAILSAVTEQTRIIYLCSPNNPTGSLLTAKQLETLISNVPDHVLFVTDEVYHHFVTANNYHNSINYVRDGKNIVIIHSFSKAYSLAGLRLGYGIAPPEIAQYLARVRLPFHLNNVTFEGGIAALRDSAHIQETIELTISGREWLYRRLAESGLDVWPTQANFLLFRPPFAAKEISEMLLQRGIIVRPMTAFYLPDHLRVSVGLPAENERFIAVLNDVLDLLG